MKLRQKTFLMMLAIYVPFIFIFYLGVRTVMLRNHELLEQTAITKDLTRIENALDYDLKQLDALNFDWSAWNDTCDYMADRNTDYEEANLIEESYTGTRLSFMTMFSVSNELIYCGAYDHEADHGIELWPELGALLRRETDLLTPPQISEPITGLITADRHLFLISIRHIINSKNEPPSRGRLMMGKEITPSYTRQLNEITKLEVEFLRNTRLMTTEERKIYEELRQTAMRRPMNSEPQQLIVPLNQDTVAGYQLVPCLTGETLMMRVIAPRSIYRSGQRSLFYMILYILVIGLISCFILMELIEKLLISRMIRLSRDLMHIAEHPDTPAQLSASGKDEFTSIINTINHLLKVLSARRRALTESEEKYRSFAQNFQGIAYRSDLDFAPVFFHGAVKAITGYTEQDFLTDSPRWLDIVIPEDQPHVISSAEQCRDESSFTCERQYRIRHRDGSLRWIHDYMQNVQDSQSGPIFIQGAMYDITDRKMAEEEIRKAKDQLDMLTRHLQEVRETESSRIARRLHDELGQLLMALKIDVRWILKKAAPQLALAEQTHSTLDTLTQIENCINNIASELKPSVLDSLGLQDAIEWLAHKLKKEYENTITCEIDLPDFTPGKRFSAIVFRIVQEGLVNVYRHAVATEISLRLFIRDNTLFVILKDNGVGITEKALDSFSSFGLVQMRERAESINGKLSIETGLSQGTTIQLLVPLTNNAAIEDGDDD